jgi:Zinc carboxypeptidase
MKKRLIIGFVLMLTGLIVRAQNDNVFRAVGTPEKPKVQVSWDRYYTYDGITDICHKLAAAHPDIVHLSSIGKSFQGKEMWVLTVTDFKTGNPDRKPGFYLDGNIHSNEVQGTEMALYTAWYLSESFDVPFIRELLGDKVFYIVPTINPDARDHFMKKPNSPHSPRSGLLPIDNDRDMGVNEDGFDDLDGDGNITQMIRKTPQGRFKKDPNEPRRLIPVKPEEPGEYEILGFEGIDNDGDGRVNEDGEGYYDPNRDWGWKWQPNYIQNGAYKYPFSLPENRNILNFVMSHPNIAGAQSFHNNGGQILRGPGAEEDINTYSPEDIRIYDAIGKKGEIMIPGYHYLIIYKDLYTVFGGEIDWFYGGRGVYTFSNELFNSFQYFGKNPVANEIDDGVSEPYLFDKLLLFGDGVVSWKEYEHPQYGKIEIGGVRKNFTRAHPGFLLESDSHRNMSFVLYHAYHMPKLEVSEITERKLGNGLTEVTAVIANQRIMPTHSGQDLKYKIERPDYISLIGTDVITGMIVDNRDMGITREQKNNPGVLEIENIRGMGAVIVRWVVKGDAKYTVSVDSRKGGTVSRQK